MIARHPVLFISCNIFEIQIIFLSVSSLCLSSDSNILGPDSPALWTSEQASPRMAAFFPYYPTTQESFLLIFHRSIPFPFTPLCVWIVLQISLSFNFFALIVDIKLPVPHVCDWLALLLSIRALLDSHRMAMTGSLCWQDALLHIGELPRHHRASRCLFISWRCFDSRVLLRPSNFSLCLWC